MLIEINANSDRPIYIQLRDQIVRGIACDQLHDGDTLPSVRNMAEALGVNMHTVHKAYGLLREDGYLILDRRHGAVISLSGCDKQSEMDKINRHMEMIVAAAICKEISKDELTQMINDLFDQFE